MSETRSQIALKNERDTTRLARRTAAELRAGDVLLLRGQIGAGKTFFARRVIQTLLAVPEEVPSPTFTLVQVYNTPRFDIWHCDLYRLAGMNEAFELGIEEAMEEAVCLIEWPDKLENLLPKKALALSFSTTGKQGERIVALSSICPRWQSFIGAIHD